MSYEVKILADSRHPEAGARLTTFEVVFPRFILAEVNTHRILSRNSASSRAIPPERIIQEIYDDPFIPETFNNRVIGMGVGDPLEDAAQQACSDIWINARNNAVASAYRLMEQDVDKSRVNRLLEPFMWHTAIISATDWENFFALRTDEGAQPEFRIIAKMMQDALADHEPHGANYNEWHLPLIEPADYRKYAHKDWVEGSIAYDHGEYQGDWRTLQKIAVGRLARRSSYNRTDPEPDEKSIERCKILSGSGHWSPFEHVARPIYAGRKLTREIDEDWSGNFFGWHQYRKDFTNEDNYAKMEKT